MRNLNGRKKSNNKRNNKGILNIFTLLLFIVFIFIIFANNVSANKYYETKKIVVSKGDTLWNIANKISKKNENVSVYTVIEDIERINNLEDSIIYEGQTLDVYVY